MSAGAVFDLDGTLVRGTSAERLLVPWLMRRGVVGWRQLAAAAGVAAALPFLGRTRALRRNKRWLAGVASAEVLDHLDDFVEEALVPRWCPGVVARMEGFRARGVPRFILSGAPDFLARAVGRHFGVAGAVGTELERAHGRFTGRLSGTHWFGPAKSDALDALVREHDVELEASWGFADHLSDVPFLERFGHPVAVAPESRLRRVARERGWEVLACDSPEGTES